MKVITEITNRQVIDYFRAMKSIDTKDFSSPEYATLVVKSAIECNIVLDLSVESLDTMRTGSVVSIAAQVNNAVVECMKPDPN